MKIVLEYDEVSGQLTDKNDALICTWAALKGFDAISKLVPINGLISLKTVGFSIQDILVLNKEGLLSG